MGRRDESREPTPDFQRGAIDVWELEEVLDQALSQLNSGGDLEQILARYPARAGVLRTMLRAAQAVRRTPPPGHDAGARQAGLNRLIAAVEARRNERVATVLDDAIARLSTGRALESIVVDNPAYADEIRPLLEAAAAIAETPQPVPNPREKLQGRARLLRAVAALRRARDAARRQAELVPETSRTFEDALDEALAWLRDGADVETALARYPAFAARLRPLLRVAEDVQRVPPPIPAEEAYFAGRQRVVRLAARRRRHRQVAEAPARDRAPRLADLLSQLLGVAPRLRRAAITVVLLAAMILGSFSVTQVAADSLPTSPLYPVKRFTEQVRLAFTPSTEGKAKLHLRFSQERFREVEALARQTGKVDSDILADMLEENDRFLGKVKTVTSERQRELMDDGARLFDRQHQALRELVGQAGDGQAMAEEVQRDLAALMPSPTPVPATAMPEPSPTSAPVKAEEPVKATPVPATAQPVPPTPTPSPEPGVVLEEPAGPTEQVMPTAASTATATPAATATSPPVATSEPAEPAATPTPEPTATPAPTESEVTPSPTPGQIELPTVPPPPTETPVP